MQIRMKIEITCYGWVLVARDGRKLGSVQESTLLGLQ